MLTISCIFSVQEHIQNLNKKLCIFFNIIKKDMRNLQFYQNHPTVAFISNILIYLKIALTIQIMQ